MALTSAPGGKKNKNELITLKGYKGASIIVGVGDKYTKFENKKLVTYEILDANDDGTVLSVKNIASGNKDTLTTKKFEEGFGNNEIRVVKKNAPPAPVTPPAPTKAPKPTIDLEAKKQKLNAESEELLEQIPDKDITAWKKNYQDTIDSPDSSDIQKKSAREQMKKIESYEKKQTEILAITKKQISKELKKFQKETGNLAERITHRNELIAKLEAEIAAIKKEKEENKNTLEYIELRLAELEVLEKEKEAEAKRREELEKEGEELAKEIEEENEAALKAKNSDVIPKVEPTAPEPTPISTPAPTPEPKPAPTTPEPGVAPTTPAPKVKVAPVAPEPKITKEPEPTKERPSQISYEDLKQKYFPQMIREALKPEPGEEEKAEYKGIELKKNSLGLRITVNLKALGFNIILSADIMEKDRGIVFKNPDIKAGNFLVKRKAEKALLPKVDNLGKNFQEYLEEKVYKKKIKSMHITEFGGLEIEFK